MKYQGQFWLKGEEHKVFMGELKLGKRESELSLLIPSTDKPDSGEFFQSDPLRPVIGATTCGKRIVLTDYHQVTRYFLISSIPRRPRFVINEAFVNLPAEEGNCDPEVETAVITSEPLVEWCGVSSHKSDPDHRWAVKYSPSDDKEIYRNADFTVKLSFGATLSHSGSGASIADSASIVIESAQPLAWSRAFKQLSNILDAVSIGCGGYCNISQARAVSREPRYIAEYHFHSPFPDSKAPRSTQWLFTLRDLPDSAFIKWMEKADDLNEARAMFFSAKHHRMFTETRMLLLIQAVEAYCRRVHEKDEYKRGYLKKHLHRLRREYADPISVVFPDASPRVKAAVDFRNDQTHSLKILPKPDDDYFALEHFLLLILEICFMSQLGLSTDKITGIVESSNKYRQLSRMYKKPLT